MTQNTAARSQDPMIEVTRQGSRIMLYTLFAQAVAAVAIGQYYGDLTLALGCSAVLLLIGGLAHGAGQGRALGWVPLTVCNVAFVALHIQLGRGTLEFHFGVFVLLGILLVYRDWRPIVLAAGLFAVHHIVFDRLQAMNLGFFCTPEPNFLKILMHAGYVVVQTGVEIVFARQLRQAARASAELSSILHTIDGGDQLRLDVADVKVTSPVAQVLKGAMLKVSAALVEVRQAVASIETASSEIAAGNLDLSQRTETQASNLQQTAASMEQLTGAVRNTAETARQASEVASTAAAAAEDGGSAVGTVVTTMDGIARSSRRIDDINGVIDGIAFQTNILALNAAVEAARAGEEGRGFAVVAAEVRLLAQRSAAAAKEIKALIAQSVEQVDRGTEQVGAAGQSVDRVVGQARQVSQLLGEISNATGQQMQGIALVGEAVTQLDSVTQQNAALVEQSAAAAQSLKQQALKLDGVLRRFVLSPA